jgi:hypothetical protein
MPLNLGLRSPDVFLSDINAALARVADDDNAVIYGSNIFLLNDPSFVPPTPEQCPCAILDFDDGYMDTPGSQFVAVDYLVPVKLNILHYRHHTPNIAPTIFLDRLRMRTIPYLEEPDDTAPTVGLTPSVNDVGDKWWHWRVIEEAPRLTYRGIYSLVYRKKEFRFPPEIYGQEITLPFTYLYAKRGKTGDGVNVP